MNHSSQNIKSTSPAQRTEDIMRKACVRIYLFSVFEFVWKLFSSKQTIKHAKINLLKRSTKPDQYQDDPVQKKLMHTLCIA